MEVVSNITNEILFVGSIFKKPDLFIEYGHNIRSKYDFHDEGHCRRKGSQRTAGTGAQGFYQFYPLRRRYDLHHY